MFSVLRREDELPGREDNIAGKKTRIEASFTRRVGKKWK